MRAMGNLASVTKNKANWLIPKRKNNSDSNSKKTLGNNKNSINKQQNSAPSDNSESFPSNEPGKISTYEDISVGNDLLDNSLNRSIRLDKLEISEISHNESIELSNLSNVDNNIPEKHSSFMNLNESFDALKPSQGFYLGDSVNQNIQLPGSELSIKYDSYFSRDDSIEWDGVFRKGKAIIPQSIISDSALNSGKGMFIGNGRAYSSSGFAGIDHPLLKRDESASSSLSLFNTHLSEHFLDPLFYAPPVYTRDTRQVIPGGESDTTPLYGYALLSFTILILVTFIYVLLFSKMMPESNNVVLNSVKNDQYYILLVPISGLTAIFFVFGNWMGMKYFRHN
ncbi:hypothetical protein AYI68_g3551 [Smittium mucronatum]|uniref:Uncharacterized protein n=1 Tax=Smittium mucronatum TaxID=133383 RepID=A0A1R0GZL6_9FUNG|nr:hypothetical protein AYI68_g3551 [Smittium mucronatum]